MAKIIRVTNDKQASKNNATKPRLSFAVVCDAIL